MISELELTVAIEQAGPRATLAAGMQLAAAGIDPGPVIAYAERYAKVCEAGEKPYANAAAGGFALGFQLGVIAARLERDER